MLQHLSIKNYALIQELSISLSDGLSIITGETGAGKSILLGALGLVLGNRADSSTLLNKEQKCVVEATFLVAPYNLISVFEQQDLDYEPETLIRREILPSGKSRAFVNDTPVTLQVLHQLKTVLIDVHSQHQTLQISNTDFQIRLLDALAGNKTKVSSYKRGLQQWQKTKKELQLLQNNQKEANLQFDYNLHLFQELEEANLQLDEQQGLEQKLEKLNNAEAIKNNLSEALQLTLDENLGVLHLLTTVDAKLKEIASFSKEYQELSQRISSVKIELDDVVIELENQNESIDINPNEIEQLNDRLQLIYNLQKKHGVNSIKELQDIHKELVEKVDQVTNATEIIEAKEKEIHQIEEKLNQLAAKISKARSECLPKLISNLEAIITDLGMPQGRFKIELTPANQFLPYGKDELSFLFSANKGGNFGDLKKVASGGELSRIMLAIKKTLSENSQLPTIIFDEIDTGVSGEISNKMAGIMQQMSKQMQVITITHLPQIAAIGNHHYKVFKTEMNGKTQTNLQQLSNEQRIEEIAQMLGGKNVTESAIAHAKELLN